jgi:hypothetical protein
VARGRDGRPFHLLQGDGIEEPGQRVLVLPGLLVLFVCKERKRNATKMVRDKN